VSAFPPLAAPARRTLAALLLAFAATHGLYQVARAWFHPKQGLDLAPCYLAGRLAREGARNWYDDASVGLLGASLGIHGPDGAGSPVLNYIYPPWVGGVYAPLSLLPWGTARRVWFVLSLLAFASALAALVHASVPPGRRRAASLAALAAACFFFPFAYGLMTGQSNDLLLLLTAGALLLLARRRPLLAGAILAPAVLWKPFLAAVVPFLVARREGKALATLAVGGAALLLLGGSGPGGWGEWLAQISIHNGLSAVEPRNHSLAAAVLALGLPPEWALPATRLFQLLALVAAGLLLLPSTRPGEARYALQFGGALAVGVLLTPKAWEHYGLYLLPAFVAAAAVVLEEGAPPRPAAFLGGSFAVWSLLFQGREEYAALAGSGLGALAALKAAATVVLLLVAIRLVRRRPDETAAPE
jgi:hypothetical protein